MIKSLKLIALSLLVSTNILSTALASGVAATVNGQVITTHEVSQRQKLMTIAGGGKNGALNELIEDKVKLSAAKKYNINVSQADVDSAFANIAKGSKMSPEKLAQMLGSRGVEARTLKERLRADMTWRQLVQMRHARDNPTQFPEHETLSKFVRVDGTSTGGSSEYSLARITVTANSSSKDAARKKAESLRSGISSCSNLAQKFENQLDVVVSPAQTKSSKDLSPSLVSFLEKSAIGKATPAFESENGYEIGVLCARKSFNGGAAQSGKSKVNSENDQKKLQNISISYLKELKSEAVIDIQK